MIRVGRAICGILSLLASSALAARVVVRFVPRAPIAIAAGATVDAVLGFEIEEGYHLQANPASAPFLKPVLVEMSNGCGVAVGTPLYPNATPYRLQGADSDLATYVGHFEVVLPLHAQARVADRCSLHGVLRYQACSSRTCLAPSTIDLAVALIPPP